MNYWRIVPSLAAALLLSCCAATQDDFAGQPGSNQAIATCRAQSNMIPAMQNAASNPFFAAAMQQQYVNDWAFGPSRQVREMSLTSIRPWAWASPSPEK